MNTTYLEALARRHASVDRLIAEEQKAPVPDSLKLMQLKKLRLTYRDRIRTALQESRRQLIQRQDIESRRARRARSEVRVVRSEQSA